MRYRRKRANYRMFRERVRVPLVAIELAYGPDFELGEEDAEILVQLRGGDILWQKERLLNLALQALPDSCRKVACVDCDVVFAADDWAQRTSRLLDQFVLVQPFSHVHRMPPDWEPGQLARSRSAALRAFPHCLGHGASDVPGHPFQADRLHGRACLGGAPGIPRAAPFL
jgi:hypothetical protein